MNKMIVITSINSATASVRKWVDMTEWKVIVVGDRKTPQNWQCPPARYLSPAAQEMLPFQIVRKLPWNHYARKLVGYLLAIGQQADIILDTDDDNMPKSDWSIPEFEGNFLMTSRNMGMVNVYRYFTDLHIWPRGFPLNRVCDPASQLSLDNIQQTGRSVKVAVWQGLADGDPDVDAVYRMTIDARCTFDNKPPIVLNSGTVSPFNSQNTTFLKPVFPLLYLPAFVSFRSTDIIRSLVAQPILWAAGYFLGITRSTVVQNRNAHDDLLDFESEIPCYLHAERILNVVSGAVSSRFSIIDNLILAYEKLIAHRLIQKNEMELLSAWVVDIQNMKTDLF